MTKQTYSLPLNLQLFAEGGMGGGDMGGGASQQPTNVSSNSEPSFQGTPGWGLPQGATGNQAAGVNPLLADQQPSVFDFAGRKVEVADPNMLGVLKDVHKDYSTLQGTYTQTSQRLKDIEAQNQTLMQLVQNFQSQQAQVQPQAPQNQEPTPEDLERAKEDFLEKFYEDPLQAIGSLLDKQFQSKVQPVIEPITKEREWNDQVSSLSSKYQDFKEYIQPMQDVLKDMPHLAQQGLETVYFVAKGRSAQAAPNPEQLVNDPNFVQQHILSNPQLQQQFLSNYLTNKQTLNQQTPVVMGGQPGGQPPAMPADKPKSLREASKAFLKNWS